MTEKQWQSIGVVQSRNQVCTKPKIGQKVTVHYEIGGPKMYVTKIENAGKAEKGSKKI